MQSTNNILLIKPSQFVFNTQTANSNVFQNKLTDSEELIKQYVDDEFENLRNILLHHGINVTIINDTETPQKPDALFPNNWISFHSSGKIILYPMLAENRRVERRMDIIDTLKNNFIVTELIDLSKNEKDNIFLEGTGSIVFDHINKIAYACLSQRTNKVLFIEVCKILNYQPIYFSQQLLIIKKFIIQML